MNTTHSNSDSLLHRLLRRRREIIFAIALTVIAAVYTVSSREHDAVKAPVAMHGAMQSIE